MCFPYLLLFVFVFCYYVVCYYIARIVISNASQIRRGARAHSHPSGGMRRWGVGASWRKLTCAGDSMKQVFLTMTALKRVKGRKNVRSPRWASRVDAHVFHLARFP